MSNINEKNLGPRWYVAHTYTGYENKVKISIEKIVENRGLGHLIYDIKVPVEVYEEVNDKGEVKQIENKLFPSYVFVKMTMTDESWHVVRNITGVTGFVGPGSEPTPLTNEEVAMFQVEAIKDDFNFNIGDKVKVVDGMFAGYSGILQNISEDKKQLGILVSTEKRDFPIVIDTKDVRLAD
ncbi:MAG: transcription termination/antitermination factor NusG [Ruminococcaceae bacterium]|nr:transcription termination/antitermination factor NusG [Oscillospiraceae bacterium]